MTENAIRIKCDLCENASPSRAFREFQPSGVSIQPARAIGLDTWFNTKVKRERKSQFETRRFTCAQNPLMGRSQVARVKSIAERIMRITIPHPRCTRNEVVVKLNHLWVIWCALKLVISKVRQEFSKNLHQ